MNILFIHNLFGADSRGGAEEIVRLRAQRFHNEGHTVFVLSTCKKGHARREKIGNISVTYIATNIFGSYSELQKKNTIVRIFWHVYNIVDWRSAKKIIQFCTEQNIDRIETHNLMGVTMQLPRLIRNSAMQHYHYLHDVQLVEPSGILSKNHTKDTLFQRIYSLVVRHLFGSPAVVYSPTIFLQKFYQARVFFKKSQWNIEYEQVVPVSINKENERAREENNYLFVGTLVEHKGVREVLSAWKEFQNKHTTSKKTLTIAGDGPLRLLVEDTAKNDPNITYLGRVPHDELAAVYQAADVLVFPSQCMENRPNVIAEAMEHGLKIIATRTGGVPEMVQGYEQVQLIDEFTFDV